MTNPNEPRLGEPHPQVTQIGANYWNDAALQPQVESPPIKRERIFPRKVLIGWALATAAAYFGFQVFKVAMKESFRHAAVYTTGIETTPDNREVIYTTPNGKLVITKSRQTGQITIRKAVKGHVIAPPAPVAPPAPAAPPAATALPSPSKRSP